MIIKNILTDYGSWQAQLTLNISK